MRVQRVKHYIASHSWGFLIAELLIVVVGVFLGLQLENWNDERERHQSFLQAKDRLQSEIKANLKVLNTLDAEVKQYIKSVTTGFDALLSCDDSPETVIKVNRSLNAITGTFGVNIRTEALETIIRYEQLQDEAYRDLGLALNDAKWMVDLSMREADFVELLPLEKSAQASESVMVSDNVEFREVQYSGADYSRRIRDLVLAVPVSQACKDKQLVKRFYFWERWQGFVPRLISNLQLQYQNLDELLESTKEGA